MDVVTVEHLSKSYGDLRVLSDLSFSVHQGEVLAIIGPSGSGKSTLLRAITHLETATSGTIAIAGTPIVKDGVYADAATLRGALLKLGLVFQDFNLFPHFSVLRNVTEAQVRVLGRKKAEARDRALSLLDKMGLAGKADAYPCELSGGQKQRVSIARALALDPQVLLFDEPTSALDPELTGEILKVIRALAAEKMTMVVVTHEMHFARDVADRAMLIDGGVVVEEGPARELIDNPRNERTRAFLRRFSQGGPG
ncbi:amino acid ABC transporter ATP-binding protein [Anaeromyxobacter paludicola]|uniref:L-cystine ABC transporter ATP-binding protein YecC n=1 Tax=Anaeromyxobacter paludicola TaxID=2918171 RepID=A0ABN6N5S7_9BACT|nr:amino acid ABC transporter ATP-binding protein [Anaeromyxobacter paludicola]BDG08547.1 L-cystine ABC transporter ATP-binding protein YecC [Anaeromyxobacter paludicola]